ncbi:sugar 3,4-ketoisomerase [Cellulosilyticum lentocellum]|uniref:WxcM-like domain-containing protein n=1 Tax=Cellulosilyticum lentocellum (strain ATCC 49066 / DSM 5427 / NCIMB 11756 / RHM5) TaxID=642492 RepID=F2JIL0_CELLD|nr:FdtA/QdtA family cupin domain-containing protein [Cellulosilyticum lentocellum]ADZ85480.1 WxcM-like domain-containing protein [Cellulosilyticum lentocellum DSM 5427]
MKEFKIIEWKENGGETGKLVVIEGIKNIPFEIKRLFYIYGMDKEAVRGQHSNRKSEFVMLNVCGSAKVRLHDGKKETIVSLDKPNMGLYIPKLMWKDMYDFSEDCVMLVLSNEAYDSDEYIKDFDEFLREVAQNE